MKHLLLLLVFLLAAPAAMAQWTFESNFPADESILTPNNHGMAVDAQGKVWIQSYYAQTRDSVKVSATTAANSGGCSKVTNMCRATVVYVLNPDGTQASFSPLSIVTRPGGVQDTLGGNTIINGTGKQVWDYNTGRGLRTGPDGNVTAVMFGEIYKFDSKTGAVLNYVKPTTLDNRGLTAPGFDANGNMFITGVFSGDALSIFNSNFDFVENVVAADKGFNRTVVALPDGNTVFSFNYSSDVATVYQRDDEFDATWDSTRAAFRGMSVESAVIHPTTGNIWASSGSPNDPPTGRYQPQTWYEFTVADVLSDETPTPLDSIAWNNPNTDATLGGRPRAIAFSPDGKTAYVGEFNVATNSVQKFTFGGTIATEGTVEGRAALNQNQPNPFSGSTDISFSLEQSAYTRLRVLDLTGREVSVLVDGQMGVGEHRATFRPQGLASGVYVYMLEVDGQATTRRMLHIVR